MGRGFTTQLSAFLSFIPDYFARLVSLPIVRFEFCGLIDVFS